jgi:flagellar protein FlaG
MPITSVGSSANVAPVLKIPGIQAKTPEQRAIVNQVIASLPGNGGGASPNQPDLHRVVADIAHVSQTFNKKLEFVVDHQSHEVTVKVIDKETDKVIKVIPPEELQRLHRMLKETIGFLFNEEV